MPELTNNWHLFFLPIIAALIGYLTNYIAVKMIFRPHKKYKILFFFIQGLIPKRQEEIAEKLGELVEEELVHKSDITTLLKGEKATEVLFELASNIIDNIFKNIITIFPMAQAILNENIVTEIKKNTNNYIKTNSDIILQKITGLIESQLNFKKIVKQKIMGLNLDKLEELTFKVAKKELKHIEILGGVLGFFIGLIQVFLIILDKIW